MFFFLFKVDAISYHQIFSLNVAKVLNLNGDIEREKFITM